jgi:hypothetical protein
MKQLPCNLEYIGFVNAFGSGWFIIWILCWTLKSSVFWDILPHSPLKVNQHFGGTCCLHHKLCLLSASCWILARLTPRPWRWRQYVPLKRQLTLNGLHGVVYQKMVLFITTAVWTSSPVCWILSTVWGIFNMRSISETESVSVIRCKKWKWSHWVGSVRHSYAWSLAPATCVAPVVKTSSGPAE